MRTGPDLDIGYRSSCSALTTVLSQDAEGSPRRARLAADRQPVLLRCSSLDVAPARPNAKIVIRLLGFVISRLYIHLCPALRPPTSAVRRTPVSCSEFDVGHTSLHRRYVPRLG
jgi:hypothetical protein